MNCGCYAVNPSDITPVLIALEATIKTNMREISALDFSTQHLKVTDALRKGEIVEEIRIPLIEGATMHYDKFRLRDSVDFAIASLSSCYSLEKGKFTGARLVFGGVAPVPIRAHKVEGYLLGKEVTDEVAEKAAELAVENAIPMEKNGYKILELKALIKNSILRMK